MYKIHFADLRLWYSMCYFYFNYIPYFIVYFSTMDDEIDMASVGKADAIDPEREAYYQDDPNKALKKFFDRESAQYVKANT